MGFVFATARKDIRRRLADPAALVFWIGIPLLLGGLLSFISGTGEAPPRATVLVVDQDNTAFSGLFPTLAAQTGSPIDLVTVTLEEGQRRIDAGDATALLVLPRGFQSAVLGSGSAVLQLVTNPSQQVLPRIVEQSAEMLVDAAFYTQALFGEPLRRIADQAGGRAQTDAEVSAIAVDVTRRIAALEGSLLPPVIDVTVDSGSADDGPALNFGQLFLPGMLFMSFLFIAQGMSADLWDEKRQGTLRRALTTPQSASRLLAGKLLAAMAVAAAIGLAGLIAGTVWFDLSWWRIPAALVWCVYVSGVLVVLLMLLHTAASSQRGAELLTSIVVFPLMMLGGSFFPFEAMPEWMAAAGRWTPNGLGVARLKELLYGDVSPGAMAMAALGIGIPACLAFVAARRRVRSFAHA